MSARARLEALRGKAAATTTCADPFDGLAALARLRRPGSRPAATSGPVPAASGGGRPTARLLPDASESGAGWLVRRERLALRQLAGMHPSLGRGASSPDAALAGVTGLLGARPGSHAPQGGLLFLDLETTGLRFAGTLAWCVGLARLDGDALVLEQHVLDDPAGEAELLARVDALIAAAGCVVTFNGRSFDLPLLEARRVLSRRPPLAPRCEVDLLPPARRLFGRPDSRLVSLERVVGRERGPDIPGAEIPRAWFDWLTRGEASAARLAVDHNRDDLVAMAALFSWMAAMVSGEGDALSLASATGLGQLRLAQGDRAGALAVLLRSALPDAHDPEAFRRACLLQRLLGRRGARTDWERLVAAGARSALPWENLAKVLEHDDRDPEAALALVERGLLAVTDGAGARRLERRLGRLQARVARGAALADPCPSSPSAERGRSPDLRGPRVASRLPAPRLSM